MDTALVHGPVHHLTENGKKTLCGLKVTRVIPTPTYAMVLCRPCINEMVGKTVDPISKEIHYGS